MNSVTRKRNQPTDVTITLSEFDWLRIRASLLCSAEDLSQVDSPQTDQYFNTYKKVKDALAELLFERRDLIDFN